MHRAHQKLARVDRHGAFRWRTSLERRAHAAVQAGSGAAGTPIRLACVRRRICGARPRSCAVQVERRRKCTGTRIGYEARRFRVRTRTRWPAKRRITCPAIIAHIRLPRASNGPAKSDACRGPLGRGRKRTRRERRREEICCRSGNFLVRVTAYFPCTCTTRTKKRENGKAPTWHACSARRAHATLGDPARSQGRPVWCPYTRTPIKCGVERIALQHTPTRYRNAFHSTHTFEEVS